MAMQRRTFLGLGAAGALGVGASLLGSGQALADPAPADPFAVGVRQYTWWRGSRRLTTYIYYPATGSPGGNPISNAPVADGVFPVYNYTHGWGSSPQNSMSFIRPLAAAGFIVPAPHFSYSGAGEVRTGEPSRDVSEIITQTLALNSSGALAGHIRTDIGVGVSGHSLGGMTTHGLLTAWPDSRIISANPQSCEDMGTPSSSINAKVVFVHGDRDDLTRYSSARQAYEELTWPKGFLTFVGGSHTSFWGDDRFPNTVVEWARWSMYGDTAARDRLRATAEAGSGTRWEAELGEGEPPPPPPPSTLVRIRNVATGMFIDGMGRSSNGDAVGQWGDSNSNNQQWEVVGDGSYKRLKNRGTGQFLDGMGRSSNGSDAGQWGDSNSTNQQWSIESGGGYVRYRNRATGLYLDGMGRSSNGSDLGQWSNGSSSNQRWTVVAAS